MPTATRRAKKAKSKVRVVIREITSADDPLLDDAYDLLSGSFEKHELVSVLEWRDTLAEKDAQVWSDISWHLLVAARGQKVLGVATGTYLGNMNVGAIGYLVVHPDARGLGLGPRLRSRLKAAFRRDAGRINETELAGVVGEVRRDNPWLRRLVKREDVIALDFPYYQPSLRSGESPVPFVFYYEGVGDVRRTLKAKELSQLLYTIWRRIYRVARPMTSMTFRRMVGNLAGRRVVGEIVLGGSAS
ncbi:MAG: GNAT family N-acetyltransferase [Gemmatimonadales bacterium]